jgi:hypothetical protein
MYLFLLATIYNLMIRGYSTDANSHNNNNINNNIINNKSISESGESGDN